MNIEKFLPFAHQLHIDGTKIGFTCSSFDLLHAGHYLMLKDARSQCNFLVVGLREDNRNEENKNVGMEFSKLDPIQSWEERLIQIQGCKYVSAVIKYTTEKDLYEILRKLKPDIRILGSNWEGKKYTGWDLDIPIYWHKREGEYRTEDLRRRVYEVELEKRKY